MSTDRITALTGRIAFYGGEEKFVQDLPGLVAALAAASSSGTSVQVIEILGKGSDGSDYRVLLEPVGVFKEQAPIGYQTLLFERALGDILVANNVITMDQLKAALGEQGKSAVKERLGEVLVRLKMASAEQVRDALLRQLGHSQT